MPPKRKDFYCKRVHIRILLGTYADDCFMGRVEGDDWCPDCPKRDMLAEMPFRTVEDLQRLTSKGEKP